MNDTVYACFREQVERVPEHTAVFDEERSLTYRQLDRLATTIAERLPRETGLIGIMADHGVEMIASILAVLRRGDGYVPVEPDFPEERIRHMMEESAVHTIITRPKYAAKLAGFDLLFVEPGEPIREEVAPWALAVDPRALAYVLYTSGSTGTPKGVAVENRNVCHYVRAFRHEFHPDEHDVMLQYSVCSFDIFVEEVFTTLLSGATLAIPSPATRNDFASLIRFIEKNGITLISGFPYLMLEFNKLKSIPSSIRLLISGGDVLRSSYVTNLLGQTDVYNTYGPSETTVCASYFKCNGGAVMPDGSYPVGKPVTGCEILLLDEEMNPVKTGETGEICIAGDGVSGGYIGNRQKENEAFVVKDGKRMYRSGDLGILLPDGNIAFLARKDAQVMILGKRVETSEMQHVLCGCTGVEQGVVVPYADEQGLAYFVAYVVSVSGGLRLSVLRKEMGRFLPSYMIPEFFVELQALPMNANGKADTKALPVVLKEGSLDWR